MVPSRSADLTGETLLGAVQLVVLRHEQPGHHPADDEEQRGHQRQHQHRPTAARPPAHRAGPVRRARTPRRRPAARTSAARRPGSRMTGGADIGWRRTSAGRCTTGRWPGGPARACGDAVLAVARERVAGYCGGVPAGRRVRLWRRAGRIPWCAGDGRVGCPVDCGTACCGTVGSAPDGPAWVRDCLACGRRPGSGSGGRRRGRRDSLPARADGWDIFSSSRWACPPRQARRRVLRRDRPVPEDRPGQRWVGLGRRWPWVARAAGGVAGHRFSRS